MPSHATTTTTAKPEKPTPDFPLSAHPCGQWVKKILGRLHYFGKWDAPDAALAKYRSQADALHAGRAPKNDLTDSLTVRTLCAKFLTMKEDVMKSGLLSARTYSDYAGTCKRIEKIFGKTRAVHSLLPDDFAKYRREIGKTWGHVTVMNEIKRVRSVFVYATENVLLDKPVVFGQGFRLPSQKNLRKHRREQGVRAFTADEIRRMLAAANGPMKAMILLGINCGFGNTDIGTLPLAAVDLRTGWVDYHRQKTEIDRRCPLWPETVEAIREWLAVRPQPKDPANDHLVFVTKYGLSWHKDTPDNPISKEMRKLLDLVGVGGNRNFYALRHTFQTVADEARDFVAVRKIMGHVGGGDIADVYRERISDERLRAVTEHVRAWLMGPSITRPQSC